MVHAALDLAPHGVLTVEEFRVVDVSGGSAHVEEAEGNNELRNVLLVENIGRRFTSSLTINDDAMHT